MIGWILVGYILPLLEILCILVMHGVLASVFLNCSFLLLSLSAGGGLVKSDGAMYVFSVLY